MQWQVLKKMMIGRLFLLLLIVPTVSFGQYSNYYKVDVNSKSKVDYSGTINVNKNVDVSGDVNVNKTIKEQFNHLRINDNKLYPSYFILKGHKYIINIFMDE